MASFFTFPYISLSSVVKGTSIYPSFKSGQSGICDDGGELARVGVFDGVDEGTTVGVGDGVDEGTTVGVGDGVVVIGTFVCCGGVGGGDLGVAGTGSEG